jgi:hypothetical protein
MRLLLVAVLAICALGIAPGTAAHAIPGDCPPFCDRIPDSAWIAPTSIPVYHEYHWPNLAGLAVTALAPRLKFEELCASPPRHDPRDYAVAARVNVGNPGGHWQLQAQVIHWRGDTPTGGQLAESVFDVAVAGLRGCQATAPLQSPSVTVDEFNRLAAVISGPVVLHEYLVVHPRSSTVTELSLWSASPPQLPWPVISDAAVLDAMAAPLCTAYIGSCR